MYAHGHVDALAHLGLTKVSAEKRAFLPAVLRASPWLARGGRYLASLAPKLVSAVRGPGGWRNLGKGLVNHVKDNKGMFALGALGGAANPSHAYDADGNPRSTAGTVARGAVGGVTHGLLSTFGFPGMGVSMVGGITGAF